MKNAFAAKTVVQVSKSKAEIEHLLSRYGADEFAQATMPNKAAILFSVAGRLESDHSKGYAWSRLQIGPPHSFLAISAIRPPFGPFHVLSINLAGLLITLSVDFIRVKNIR